jgi:hypothetical protein
MDSDSDREIQAIIANPSISYWLSEALKAGLKRDPLDVANDAEFLAIIFAKSAQEKALQAMAWLAVQRAQDG